MGGSVGVIAGNVDFHSRMDTMETFFVDKDMRAAEQLFKTDISSRRSFLQFIRTNAWSNQLDDLGQSWKDEERANTQGSSWKKFGYRDPFHAGDEFDPRSASGSTLENQSDQFGNRSEQLGIGASDSVAVRVPKVCTLFTNEDHRVLLCAILSTLYLKYQASNTYGEGAIASTSKKGLKKGGSQKHARLREILLNAAAKCTDAELDLFLANPEASWVESFKQIVVNLPVVLMVSNVDRTSKESTVIFINRLRTEKMNTRTWESTVGHDLHKLCAEDCPRGKSRILETAIFRGHLYKTSVADNHACKLRAVVPVRNCWGEHVYAVALETPYFENPARLRELGMIEQSEKQFQQMEDVLALLPLLIKC